jgi:hypothetical protein
MQERVEALEAQLAEREQLVAALTERLEQAAEQLDRLHRTGADRGLRTGIAGVPAELIAQQQKLVEDLQKAVDQWQAMQPGELFGRLESQLGQIQDMVQQIDRSGGDASGTDSAFRYGAHKSDGGSSDHDSHGGSQRGGSDLTSSRSILDFMKKSMTDSEAEQPPQSSVQPSAAATTASSGVMDIALPPLNDPPQAIDPASATPEELGKACTARDAYITYLLHRLRQIESLGHVPNSWAGLENLPDDQRARLEALEHRLQETARVAEVELSLQRAKLARDELRIRMLDEQMQKDIKRVKDVSDSQSEDSASDSKTDQSGSRWKRMIGR